MNTQRYPTDELVDLLEKATRVLRDIDAPTVPLADLRTALLDKLATLDVNSVSTHGRFRAMLRKSSPYAASVAAIVFVVLVFRSGIGSSEIAFADVVEKIKSTESVRLRVTMTRLNADPKKKSVVISNERWINGSRTRTKYQDGSISTSDIRKGISLMLQPAQKLATITIREPDLKTQPMDDVAELFKNLRRDESKNLGEKEMNGKRVTGFLSHQNGPNGQQWEVEIWLDAKTELPVRMESRLSGKSAVYDFDWNEKMDESLFSLTPPDGYTVDKIDKRE